MLDKDLIQSTSSWPFVEIRKLLKDRKEIIRKKDKITFQTGYGPSGLTHIGTFGEVARTSMMSNARDHIPDIPTETAALAKRGTNSLWPPLRSPLPPGC